MKAVNHSWWIGAIISTVLTFAFLGGETAEDIFMSLFVGIINGVFWGWIVGLLIDKLRGNSSKSTEQQHFPDTQKEKIPPTEALNQQHLNQNGYYVSKVESGDKTLYLIMLFNSRNYVSYDEFEVSEYALASDEEFKEGIRQWQEIPNLEISENQTIVYQKGNEISMKFYDPSSRTNRNIDKTPTDDPLEYTLWQGSVTSDGLILDLIVSRYNNSLKDYERKKILDGLEFNFVLMDESVLSK